MIPITNGRMIARFKKKLLLNKNSKSTQRIIALRSLEFFISVHPIQCNEKT
jgi:hypothetical protein